MDTLGELQMPPVDQDLLNKLERMETEKGLEIHGLLVGISELDRSNNNEWMCG